MTTKDKPVSEVAVQIEWKYDEAGNAIPMLPSEWEAETIEEESTFVQWKELGTLVRGVLRGTEPLTIQQTETFKYFLQTGPEFGLVERDNGLMEANGDHAEFHGAGDLDGKMSLVGVGDFVQVTYTDLRNTNTKGRTFKSFEVIRTGPPLA